VIRLLHVADVHLGRPFQMLGEKGASQRRALEAAFVRAVDAALEHRVQLVLVAGDLFDSPKPSPATLDFAGRHLRRLDDARIRTAVVAGNHDAGDDGYIAGLDSLRAASPNTLWIGRDVEIYTFSDLDLALIARSPVAGASTSPLAGWPARPATRFAVGLAHGSFYRAGVVDVPGVIHPQEIRDTDLDYLALGDWHSAMEVVPPPTTAWYAGAPELLAFDQEGAGHALLVEIAGPGEAAVTPLAVGRRRYRRLDLDLSLLDDAGVHRTLEDAADPDAVCDAALVGIIPVTRMANAAGLQDEFSERYFRLRVTNRTQLWLDDEQLAQVPEDTVLGKFVRVMRVRIDAADTEHRGLLEEALQVGVAVLRGGELLG
jgi:DNA repair exonuclease SbcCD nuclease subunit